MRADTGYGIGFFCGALVGGFVTYLHTTKEGEALKKRLVKEYKEHQQSLTLESILPEGKEHIPHPSITQLRQAIAKIRAAINPVSKKSSSKPKAPESKSSKRYFKQK
jgi:hypothetical protein